MKKILGIMFIGIVLVAGVFVHNSIYSISEENIKQKTDRKAAKNAAMVPMEKMLY